jgi:hypothetical protein
MPVFSNFKRECSPEAAQIVRKNPRKNPFIKLFRVFQARFLGAEILVQVQAGQCQLLYGNIAPAKLTLIEETCQLNAVQEGWILVLAKQNHVKLRTYGQVQRIQQALMNVIYLG